MKRQAVTMSNDALQAGYAFAHPVDSRTHNAHRQPAPPMSTSRTVPDE